jgi:hypothetical protein
MRKIGSKGAQMNIGDRAARAAVVVIAGALGIAGVTSTAAAQRRNPVVAHAAPAPHPRSIVPYVPYPGATVTIDPRWYGGQHQMRPQLRYPHGNPRVAAPPSVYYIPVPVPMGYGGGGYGGGGGVTDVNGRPLYLGFDESASAQYGYGLGTPNLTGAPYVVGQGGVMTVDFGNGDRRPVPSCTAMASAQDPDGRPRTIFYSPPADGLVLRAGQSGRVAGAPPAGAPVCYTADQYGRLVLDY